MAYDWKTTSANGLGSPPETRRIFRPYVAETEAECEKERMSARYIKGEREREIMMKKWLLTTSSRSILQTSFHASCYECTSIIGWREAEANKLSITIVNRLLWCCLAFSSSDRGRAFLKEKNYPTERKKNQKRKKNQALAATKSFWIGCAVHLLLLFVSSKTPFLSICHGAIFVRLFGR